MKKLLIICMLCIGIQACSNSDEDTDITNLAGTAWAGTGNDEGEIYTFVTNKDYKWVGEGTTEIGTYTFDGKKGTFTSDDGESYPFEIEGLKMIIDGDTESPHIRI